MRHWFLVIAMIVLPLFVNAQGNLSKVIMKNGTEITGTIKSIDPTDAVKIVVAGIETSIKMNDIAKIEEVQPVHNQSVANNNTEEKVKVTDFAEYPESFDLKVGDITIHMVLVRGGELNMGYDGRHSLTMKSEPVHKVKLTSYYISETFVPSTIVSYFKRTEKNERFYATRFWEEANDIVVLIAELSGKPVRLPTEAEWEYAACSPIQAQVFNACNTFEYCFDIFDKYDNTDFIVDPSGPKKGKSHVIRGIKSKYGKFDRSACHEWFYKEGLVYSLKANFRIAIKAKDI